MSINTNRYFETDGSIKPEALEGNPWLKYLLAARQPYWNAERLEKMSDKERNAPLMYTLKTLDILDEMTDLPDDEYELVRKVLCWSETAKGGSEEDRERWIRRGYPVDIHNEASALIYADHYPVRDPLTDEVYILIKTHGLAGQFIRGECRMESSRDLTRIAGKTGRERFIRIICALNECIIRAVGEKIWERTREGIRSFALELADLKWSELDPAERLQALLPGNGSPSAEAAGFFEKNIFRRYDLWYFQSAMEPFGFENAAKICRMAAEAADSDENDRMAAETAGSHKKIRHLNFKPLSDAMYYDYEGKKHINTYKQRIIEKWLSDPERYGEHVRLNFVKTEISLLTEVQFTPACEKMIDFCVEAEKSGLISYEKCITMIYDLFGFRRDRFDRMNNEEKYLQTMNDAQESTKMSILQFVKGQTVVDVGSGGGVLLDELENLYPDKEIIGTDISSNVIESLDKKRREQGHKWKAVRHNFVDGPMEGKADSIIFSSIIHEIYSYTDLGNGKFDEESVLRALKNAAASLNPGGRIIIRDGVKTPGHGKLAIHFKTNEGFSFFEQFMQDFKGMDHIPFEERVCHIDREMRTVITDINYGREFLFTYTWGSESFPHEVQECFGYYSLQDFKEFFTGLGMKIIESRSLLEPGYEEHLLPLVDVYDPDDPDKKALRLPDSNCIVAAEL